ncbi:MAG: hypothetical protein ABIG64_03635 [Candidatus Omnitrophota bacterium]
MGVIEMVKKSWEASKNLLSVMVVVFAFNFVTATGLLMVIGVEPTPEKITSITGILLILFVVLMLLWFLMEGGIIAACTSGIKGNNVDLNEFPGNCVKFFTRLVAINIMGAMISLIIWFIGAFLSGIFIALGGGNNIFFNIIGGIILFLTLIIAFLVAMPLLMSQYLAVSQDGKAIDSLKKGFGLIKKYFGKAVLVFIILGFCLGGLSLVVNILGVLVGNVVKGWGLSIINILLTSTLNAFFSVFASCVILTLLFAILNQAEPQAANEQTDLPSIDEKLE